MAIPFGAISRGAMGPKEGKQLAERPESRPGILEGLGHRARAEAMLRLTLVEADIQRHLGASLAEYERRIGALVMEGRELQLKDTPATKWDIEELTKRIGDLAEAFRKDIAVIDARMRGSAHAIEDLKATTRSNEGEVAALKDRVAARVRGFAVAITVVIVGAGGGIYYA